MMKRWRALAAFLSVAVLVATGGCASASTVDRTENFSGFTRLDIQDAFNVQVTKASSFAVTVTVPKAYIDYLSVTQNGDTLKIDLTPNQPFTDFTLIGKVLKASISMPALQGLNLSGASQATVSGFDAGDDLDLNISGASSLKMNGIRAGNGDFQVSGASHVSGSFTATSLKLTVTGASGVQLSGAADDANAAASGASQIDLEQFASKTASVNLDGASRATVDATTNLDCVLGGASSLTFLDNPKIGTLDVTGASTIKHK